jgi:uncharacterized protein (UPF0261 family)
MRPGGSQTGLNSGTELKNRRVAAATRRLERQRMPKKHIAIIATCDTNGLEVSFMASLIKDRGVDPVVIDVGPMTPPPARFDFSNKRVARLAGWKLEELVGTKQRDQIMIAMGRGAIKALQALLKADQLDGVIGIGGNQGSAIASLAMKSLPIGFPKFLVSTVASGNIRPYIGHKDIAVMFSVADLVGGPNLVSRSILTNAVAALIGMVQKGEKISLHHKEKNIAISALGNTEEAVQRISAMLRKKGFHVTLAGGSAVRNPSDRIHGRDGILMLWAQRIHSGATQATQNIFS